MTPHSTHSFMNWILEATLMDVHERGSESCLNRLLWLADTCVFLCRYIWQHSLGPQPPPLTQTHRRQQPWLPQQQHKWPLPLLLIHGGNRHVFTAEPQWEHTCRHRRSPGDLFSGSAHSALHNPPWLACLCDIAEHRLAEQHRLCARHRYQVWTGKMEAAGGCGKRTQLLKDLSNATAKDELQIPQSSAVCVLPAIRLSVAVVVSFPVKQ